MLFAVNCVFFLSNWPQNVIILWLLFLGFYSRWGLILAPVFKLPLGSFEPWVWTIVFNSHTALRDSGNWFSYLWLLSLWLLAFVILRHRKVSGNIVHEFRYPDPSKKEADSNVSEHD